MSSNKMILGANKIDWVHFFWQMQVLMEYAFMQVTTNFRYFCLQKHNVGSRNEKHNHNRHRSDMHSDRRSENNNRQKYDENIA